MTAPVSATIRPYRVTDRDTVIALSLRAWRPVFDSLATILRPSGVFDRLYPDWQASQASVVAAACDAQNIGVWVGEVAATVAGFVAVQLDPEHGHGEIHLLAVDPAAQRQGVGTALTRFGVRQIRDAGLAVAMVETGGDPGHEPARRTYERAGFTALPVIRYFQSV